MITPIVTELGRLSAHQGVKVPVSVFPEVGNQTPRPTTLHGEPSVGLHGSVRTVTPYRSRGNGREVAAAA